MILKFLTLSILAVALAMPSVGEARRKKKFKTPVIVNQILRLTGTMTINGDPTHEFGGVKEGDVLETGGNSWSIFRIPGLGIYYLGADTKVKLTKFSGRDVTKFELLKGNLLCIYKRLGTHEVHADDAVVIPAGNAPSNTFWVSEQDKDAAVFLWDGKIQIQSRETHTAPAPPIVASPTPSISKAQITESNVPVDSKVDPVKPVEKIETPTFVHDMTIFTKNSWLKYLVTKDEGVKEKGELKIPPPDTKTISDMESLYALP